MYLHFPRAGTAAHSDIFQSPSKTGGFVALEVAQGDENVRIHNGASYFGFLYIFAAFHGDQFFIRPLQPVCNYHMTARGKG